MVFESLKQRLLEKRLLNAEAKKNSLERLAREKAKSIALEIELKDRIKKAKQLNLTPREKDLLMKKKNENDKRKAAIKKEAKFVVSQLGKAFKVIGKEITKSKTRKKSKSKSKKIKKTKSIKKKKSKKKSKK